ncbi:ATP-binding cassette domain-containing protein [Psychrobacter okhotskensis]|uniref:ABC transporter ATP-binding protein n=1 Tax=Psychrobacter okhotskensis TaxID=212403 RepID=UPI001566A52B|nr:ATP-binding cassette domain-containing protein [Psychrobacter okhotskensis]NRD70244.1 ATP-binding cassette domain-containing protein [Psychrobacter okhotskensis]
MSVDNDMPIVEFKDICVHSQRITLIDTGDKQPTIKAQTNNLSAIYDKWTRKFRKNASSKQILSTPKRVLINNVSGTLLAGQVTLLTGSSGSGKSVLLRVLAGLLPMSSGEVYLRNDKELNNRSDSSSTGNSSAYHSIYNTPPPEWRARIALLAQQPQLLEGTVLENLQIPYRLQAHQHLDFDIDWHIAQLVQLERRADFLQQAASYLSGGERQLVNTLRLLQLNPQVLLLDEPTAALDSDTSAQLVYLLIDWLRGDAQRSVLWVTHDTQDIMPLADRHWHMQAGVLTEVS